MAKKIKPAGKKQGSSQPDRRPAPFVAQPEALYARGSAGGVSWLCELYARPPAGQKVVLYIRTGIDQSGCGEFAMRGQLLTCQEWASWYECQIVAEFQEAVSSRVRRPPEFRRAVARAKAEQAALVVFSLDRIVRDPLLAFERQRQPYCRQRGITVFAVRD